MYVHVERKMKCSKCGAINQIEVIIKNDGSKIMRCLKCKHKKRISPPIITTSNTGGVTYYNMDRSDEELF